MTGTIINAAAILVGGGLGLLFGARIPERLKQTVVAGMGLFTAAMGLQMFLKTANPLIVLGSLLIGTLLWANGGRSRLGSRPSADSSNNASRADLRLVPVRRLCAAS